MEIQGPVGALEIQQNDAPPAGTGNGHFVPPSSTIWWQHARCRSANLYREVT